MEKMQIKQKERKLTEGREPPGRGGRRGDLLTPHVRKPTDRQAFVPTANSHKRALHFHRATPSFTSLTALSTTGRALREIDDDTAPQSHLRRTTRRFHSLR